MREGYKRILTVTADASGAYMAALAGQVVVIVDVIDMSTTLEVALQNGAALVLGASPVPSRAPVPVNPAAVGRYAADAAGKLGAEVVVIAEPRVGKAEERQERSSGLLRGLHSAGIREAGIYPNLGAETGKLVDFQNKVVVAVTDCGGVAYDAAFNAGAPVITGTVARTPGYTGWENARSAVERALRLAEEEGRGIALVASSGKSAEDVLATHYLAERLRESGFCYHVIG
ncbi:MAG: hypothetical protein PWQ39_427 [Thermacetogenium sp.]|nr:hypothetical protein [Thermacetogenium sp.]